MTDFRGRVVFNLGLSSKKKKKNNYNRKQNEKKKESPRIFIPSPSWSNFYTQFCRYLNDGDIFDRVDNAPSKRLRFNEIFLHFFRISFSYQIFTAIFTKREYKYNWM